MRAGDRSIGGDETAAAEIAQAASRSISREDRGLSSEERADLARWLAADPRHAAELARLRRGWSRLDAIGADRDLRAQAERVLFRAEARRRSRRRWQRTWLAAAGLLACVLAGRFAWERSGAAGRDAAVLLPKENYRVLASTLRRTALPDGSLAELKATA